MTFPVRTKPATKEEARTGEAIFALDGKVRAIPLKFPIKATWTTLKGNPHYEKEKKDGKTVTNLVYWNTGRVWQAEEVLEDGKWRRYFGFVGSHRIERVPAEEIEFPPPTGPWWARSQNKWTELAPGLHGRLRGWWDDDDLYEGGSARRGKGHPLPIIVELWNARGQDQPMFALDKVLKVQVSYSPEKISHQGYLVPDGAWSPVAARTSVAWRNPPAILPPGQIVRLAPIDMRQWIDLKDSGYYQVSLGSSSLQFSQGPRLP